MEWVFRDYERSLKQSNNPLPPRYDVMEFDVRPNTKDSENHSKLQGFPSDLQDKVKRCSHNTRMCFVRMAYVGLSKDFHYRLTQVAIHIYSVNQLGMVLTSLRLCNSWQKGWMKMM